MTTKKRNTFKAPVKPKATVKKEVAKPEPTRRNRAITVSKKTSLTFVSKAAVCFGGFGVVNAIRDISFSKETSRKITGFALLYQADPVQWLYSYG